MINRYGLRVNELASSLKSSTIFHATPSLWRLCHNEGNAVFVILNKVKNLRESIGYKIEILPCLPAGRGYRLRMTLQHSLLRGSGGGNDERMELQKNPPVQ